MEKMLKLTNKKFHREIRVINKNQFDFTNEINIYDDKVAIISLKDELIGMIIESIEIANSQRAIFDMCWQFANTQSIKGKLLEPLKEKDLIPELEKKDKTSNLSLF